MSLSFDLHLREWTLVVLRSRGSSSTLHHDASCQVALAPAGELTISTFRAAVPGVKPVTCALTSFRGSDGGE